MLLYALLYGFTNKCSRAFIKTDVSISKVYSSDDISLCPGSGILKTFVGSVLFPTIIGTGLKQFLQSFRAKNDLCNKSDQTYFSDTCTFTSAGPLGRYWNSRLSGSGFNTSLWAQQMLMHRKSYLISLFKSGIFSVFLKTSSAFLTIHIQRNSVMKSA